MDADSTPRLGGLAMRAALSAVRLGHAGIAVSRIGQDEFGRTLLECARNLGVNVEHIQHDPDLPTARQWIRRLVGEDVVEMDDRAAFDNLQWDHDLIDLAMRTHVLFTGALARRSGQTRAELDRFVSECRTAIKVLDLINRDDANFDRRDLLPVLELADGVVLDRSAADVIVPAKRNAPLTEAAREVLREFKLQFAITLDDGALSLVTAKDVAASSLPAPKNGAHELVVATAMHFIAHGCNGQMIVDRTAQVVAQTADADDAPIAESLRAVD